ncbi:MAG: peptidase [Okeania sp. SIO2F4]|uniref:pre-peptidase C-terminal domain-containing protein n=1 Tax=Okeania sp. SIO2F4 TaxID=2607790 RepID=UPI00142C9EED|nr:pre-peptidase C-terminal domain-containing protein [Okeania sp. SIO2F4]NES07895.1 peptidase [Okeania sp. SIO2F4]
MRQARFWAIAPFSLLTILGKPSFFPLVPPDLVFVNSSYINEILTKSEILAQDNLSPEATPLPEITPTPEATPLPEITPTPEESPSPEITPTPEATPLPEITPTPEESPSPETTPSTQEQKVILQQEGTLSNGDLVLPSDESIYDEHSFEGTEGQVVTVTLESPDFDTYLAVFSPTGELLGEHDDINQKNTNSQLTITLTVTGKYRVIVNSYDKTGRGQYNLQVIQSGETSDL